MTLGTPLVIAHPKAMTTSSILDITVVDTGSRQGFVQEYGVAVVDHWVVDAIDEENGMSILGNTPLERERVLQLDIVDMGISQQPTARALVDAVLCHSDNGVERSHESGL